MDFINRACLNLGQFVYINKKRIGRIKSVSIRFFANGFRSPVFDCNRLEKHYNYSFLQMEIHWFNGNIWHFFARLSFSIAQTQIDSSVSSILNSLTPLNTLVLGVLVFGLQLKRTQVIAVIIGLLGSALLILNGALNHPEQNYFYAILVIIASVSYALNVHLIKKYLSDLSPLSISTGNFLVLFFPALVVLYASGFFEVMRVEKVQHSVLFILILGIVGTGIANIIFFKLIQISSPVFATTVTYLIPVVAFFWGMLDYEILTPIQFLGAFIILVGVYLSAKK